MATTPLLTTFLGEIRTAVAGMAAPTYNHTLSAGQVTADPDEVGSVLPYVQVYVAGDVGAPAITLTDREITATIFIDCAIADQGTRRANREAVLLLLHDLSILLSITRREQIFASYGKVVGLEHTLNYHGDADVGGVLPFGRLTVTLRYHRAATGGF